MTATNEISQPSPSPRAEATALALRLAHAENALRLLTSGQVDAIVDPEGKAYLLRLAQEQLRQNERRLQAVIESAADVITVVDRTGVILSQNHAVRRVLGYEPGEMVGSSIFEFIHEDDLAGLHAAFFNVIVGVLESATVRFRCRSGDGSHRTIEATVGKVRDVSAAHVVFSFRPMPSIFPPRHLEAGAREVVIAPDPTARDGFLARLSRELRTPLTPAFLGLDELQEDERFAEARPTLRMIRHNLELQSRLLDELTEFATVTHHKVRFRIESIDVHQAVHCALETCRREIAAAQIEVLLDLQASENKVLADAVKLQQVMWNLLTNAIKFSPPGSSISISSVNEAPGSVVLEFVDHGVGIEPALLPRVFDAFQQGDPVMQQAFGGPGLGLFIARGLAEAQGGTLTASSKGRSQGATFRLTLKTAPPAVE